MTVIYIIDADEVNEKQLRQYTRDSPNSQPFCIVLCSALTGASNLNKQPSNLSSLPFGVFWARLYALHKRCFT